jgi:hypothetical protein
LRYFSVVLSTKVPFLLDHHMQALDLKLILI